MSDLVFNDSCATIGTPIERQIIGLKATVIESVSGAQQSFQNTDHDRMRYTLNWSALTASERKDIFDFYKARGGRYDTFLFKDDTEYSVSKVSIGTGDNSDKTFQLADAGFDRKNILASPAPLIYVNDVLQTVTTHYTIDYTDSGMVTFVSAPGNGLDVSADFDYYRRCRFVTQIADANFHSNNVTIPPLVFEEVIV